MNKVIKFNENLRHEYPLTKDSLVFDIGGYKGEWSKIIYDKYRCNIYCFEPVFEIDNPDIKVYNFGIGAYSGHAVINIDKDKTGIFCCSGESKIINIVGIMDFIKDNDINHIDLMKINIEGMEYELLNTLLDNDWVKNITDIQVQFHRSLLSDSEMWHIQNRLKNTHYTTYQYRYVWENWHYGADKK